ncbi:putative sulfite reductase subunit protein [Buchnera aphidicola (Cinara tujafilina)]|uniref:Sulfurtransferase n=1 Tax=Buchnera aphidicola (Cinara tujafilina) TaxID=261317 RepID=F7WZK5_9GAMM|nr:TusE/DsrC/DsvC family sulfur relay protein [Buchnera aphidicola]AEH39872.1 putative sulfite reductase subunit protein [Buchnera aphidicola (Cinara tujafilina)]
MNKKTKYYKNNKKIPKQWNIKKAHLIAKKLNILLTHEHWKIIFLIKKFYKKYNIIPTTRMLLLSLKKEYKMLLTSQDLYILFKNTPMKNISKISGLPEPQTCL